MHPVDKLSRESSATTETREHILEGPPLQKTTDPILPTLYSELLKHQEKTFLIEGGDDKLWSYGDLLKKARAWASWLKSKGYGKGHVVSVASHKNIDGFAVCVGTWLSGAAANPFNFISGEPDDIRRLLSSTVPDVVYCSAGEEKVLAGLQGQDMVIVRPGGLHPHFDSRQILSQDDPSFTPSHHISSPSHVFHINFSSGTTGTPKAILVKDDGFPIHRSSYLDQSGPIFHTMSLFGSPVIFSTVLCLLSKRPLLVEKPNSSPLSLLSIVQKYKPAMWFSLSSTMLELAKYPEAKTYDLSSLKAVSCGGDVLTAAQKRRINQEVFGGRLVLRHSYAATEIGSMATCMGTMDVNSPAYESTGSPSPGVSLKVIDEKGRSLPPGEIGEILVKTPWPTAGLMTTGRKVLEHLDDQGWYHTGDAGYYDDKKHIYVLGRCQYLLKYRGKTVSPGKLDTVIRRHSDVFDSAVVGKKDPVLGDVPVAFIVLTRGASTTKQQLQEFIAENLEESERPQEVFIVDSLPLNPRGKIIRSELTKKANSNFSDQPTGIAVS